MSTAANDERNLWTMATTTTELDIANVTKATQLSDLHLGSEILIRNNSAYSKLLEDFLSKLSGHEDVGTVILVVVYIPVFLMAFFGNLMVLLVVLPNRHMRNVTNFFIVNLAIADLTGNCFILLWIFVGNLLCF